jgi:flagellar basal-body rod modification protein FlgD
LHDFKKGDNSWTWNGKGENGAAAPVGEYQFTIEAKANNGKKLAVKTDFKGLISGVSYSAEGPVLMVGNQTVKMKDIRRIVDPSLNQKDQKINMKAPQDLKVQPPALENDEKGAEDAVSNSGIMENIAMSSGMMEKLRRETEAKPSEVKQETKAESNPSPAQTPSASM